MNRNTPGKGGGRCPLWGSVRKGEVSVLMPVKRAKMSQKWGGKKRK